jgi:hypothetical protein
MVVVRQRERSTTKLDPKNSLYPLRHFTKYLVGVFGKLPEERDLYHETTTLLINQLRAHPCFTCSNTNLIKGSIHQQTASQCITGGSWTCRQNELKASSVHNNEPRRKLKGSGAGQNSTGRQTNSRRKKNFSLDALHGGENKRNENETWPNLAMSSAGSPWRMETGLKRT